MQIKNLYAQDASGNVVSGATCTLYLAGTQTLAEGIEDGAGTALENPFAASDTGLIRLAAPDGEYDLVVEKGTRTSTLRIDFFDTRAAIGDISTALDAINGVSAA